MADRSVREAGVAATMLVAVLMAGCSAGTANPHLLAPKLVVFPLKDGNVTLFVHAAFGERMYESLTLAVDNSTIATREEAFSLETTVASAGFFVEVTTRSTDETYHLRARVDVDHGNERVRIVLLEDAGVWGPADTYSLPYERIIERVGG